MKIPAPIPSNMLTYFKFFFCGIISLVVANPGDFRLHLQLKRILLRLKGTWSQRMLVVANNQKYSSYFIPNVALHPPSKRPKPKVILLESKLYMKNFSI